MLRDLWIYKKKWILWSVGVLSLVIILTLVAVNNNNKKEKLAKAEETNQKVDSQNATTSSDDEYSKLQARMTERYGEAPKGMYYNEDGELEPLGNDKLTPEEVTSTYLRALSTLNMNTAQRYSYKTSVVKTYEKFYDRNEDFNYKDAFTKEMYKQVLTSIQPLEVKDTSLFATNKTVVTMNIKVLDLQNKDFWKDDAQNLFLNIFQFKKTESDSTKAKEYVYNYVLDYYQSETPQLRETSVSITLEKAQGGGWVVTNDDEIDAIAKYYEGEVVVSTILTSYEDWITSTDDDRIKQLLKETGKIDSKNLDVTGSDKKSNNSNTKKGE